MSQSLFVLPTLPDENWLHGRQASGLLRASAHFSAGPIAGLGIVTAQGDHTEQLMELHGAFNTSGVHVPPGAESVGLLPIPSIIIAQLPPTPVIVFVLAQIESGRSHQVAAALSQLGDGRAAYAHAFGAASFNVVMQFVGEDLEEVLGRILKATDLPTVRNLRTLYTTATLTRGFGQA